MNPIISNVVDKLAPNFIHGVHTIDDVKQQAYLYGMQCIGKYNPNSSSRTLESFLYKHIRNRLIAWKYENVRRSHAYTN
jgi:DNA-directed RNA polymerase specialized sigma24 family protein